MSNYISRYIENGVSNDLKQKMVFIGGPRQSGKTTLAKHLCVAEGLDPCFTLFYITRANGIVPNCTG